MSIDDNLLKYVLSQETYSDKAVIIEEGGHGDWVYLVLEGQVKVKKKTSRGSMTITTLKAGTIFGELVFLQLSKGHRKATIVADGDATVGLLDMEKLHTEFRSISPFMKMLLSALAKRLEDATHHLIELSL